MAMGAQARDVVAGVLSRTLAWTAAGSVVGLSAAWLLAQYFQPVLFGVKARDVSTSLAVLALLVLVSLCAAWQPASRAAWIDPARVLRHD